MSSIRRTIQRAILRDTKHAARVARNAMTFDAKQRRKAALKRVEEIRRAKKTVEEVTT